jgi:hypothetical protein
MVALSNVMVRAVRILRPTQWYAVLTILFLGIRAITTLAMDPGWDRPGTGWRSVLQLLICAVLAAGLLRRAWELPTVLGGGVLYLAMTVLEAFHGTDLLGIVPVDMRDRLVHPLLGVLALVFAWLTRRTPAAAGLIRGRPAE